jgi:hypothetical protein
MSSSEQDRVRELAERVARRLSDETGSRGAGDASESDEIASLRASLAEIQRRLAEIESHVKHDEVGERDNAATPQRTTADASKQSSTSSVRNSSSSAQTPTRSMWLSGTYVPATAHPSQEQFTGIGEAVSELVEFFEREKTCNVEPGGKPCDHCGMCSSRGF